jgi:nucleotide-binding universal stress UspA family protein
MAGEEGVVMTAAMPEWNGALDRRKTKPRSVENVILPLDGQKSTQLAIPIARELARLHGATLHVVYVGEQVTPTPDALAWLGVKSGETRGVVMDHRKGNPAERVIHAARDLPRALIVMCTHTGQQLNGEGFGAVAESILLTKPERIVLLAPEREDKTWKLRSILLAHDGTPGCHPAAGPAAELAQLAGAQIIALHVATKRNPKSGKPGSLPAPRYVDQPQHEWPAWADEFMSRMLAMGAAPSSMHFDLVVTGGQPGSEVAEVAHKRNADLVVMGWHGRWDHDPSATRVVIATAGCPVYLVCCE